MKFRSVQHIAGVLLNVAGTAGLCYRDNDLDLTECIGFTHYDTLMVHLDGEPPHRVKGTVMGLITTKSATLKLSVIAKGKLTPEVMRAQAHHYIVVPDFEFDDRDRKDPLKTLFYKKMWAVQYHQRGLMLTPTWGAFISYITQFLFRMDHPTDRSVREEAEMLLLDVMMKTQGRLSDSV